MTAFHTKDGLHDRIVADGFEVGAHSYGVPVVKSWKEGARLVIGRYCSIADDVTIFLGGNHRSDWVSQYPFPALAMFFPDAAGIPGHPATKGDVRIGSDVWLGDGCTILSGVTIGDGAAVGARAVVARDVPPYAVVAGNPARVIRTRFPDDVIARLLRLRWWDWPDDRVNAASPLLCQGDIEAFLARYG